MFKDCSLLLAIKDNYSMDNIDVTDMSYMFWGSTLLEIIDIHCKTNNVTNMNSIFKAYRNLKILPDISKWNNKNVKTMGEMFYNWTSLTKIPEISNWNTNNVTSMYYIFSNC